jgi:primosomal protein N' (replication factor Y)
MRSPKRIPKNKNIYEEKVYERHILNAQQSSAVNLINENLEKRDYKAFLLNLDTDS